MPAIHSWARNFILDGGPICLVLCLFFMPFAAMPVAAPVPAVLADLRRLIAGRHGVTEQRTTLPFGLPALDAALPGGGLALGVVHQISEAGPRGHYAATAMLFAGGLLARLKGPVLWCLHSRDLFAPALSRVGLHPDRVIFCETWKDAEILPAMEEGLRHRGLAGVVGELTRLALTPSRRLQLAAEASGVTALVVSRAPEQASEANAAFARWCVSAAPSPRDDRVRMGRPHWRVELQRCRGAAPKRWIVEACDAQGRLALPARMADRPAAAGERTRASA